MRIEPQRPVDFCGLAIIGEAPGAEEITAGIPFVGRAGKLLDTVLAEVGVTRSRCLVSNVFMSRPEDNKVDRFFRITNEDDDEFINRYGLFRDRFVVRNENRPDLERLERELVEHQPSVILLLGATALWRINHVNGITAARGKWALTLLPGIAHMVGIMPAWHPSAVLRQRDKKLPEFVADINLVKEVLNGLQC